MGRLAGQAASGARLEPTLRAEAERRASPTLLALAAGWGMSERYGAPVVDVIDGLVDGRRDAGRRGLWSSRSGRPARHCVAARRPAVRWRPAGRCRRRQPGDDARPYAVRLVDLALGLLATWAGW